MHSANILPPIIETVSVEAAQQYYGFWGQRYDWFGFFESRAKSRLRELLDLSPGTKLLNVGLGTGQEHQKIITLLDSASNAVGVDISWEMLTCAQERTNCPLCQSDGSKLPFASSTFDRLYAAYVLDLVPATDLQAWLQAFRRVLRPGGLLLTACLTEGVSTASRSIISIWKHVYGLSPIACGGCRPLQLNGLVEQAGFLITQSEVIVQLGVPSQIICAQN
jgi:ubiquinone/menaquinone biosynthesis C-methylase UbiE